jgi:transcriptional regulator NrdR family protein
MTCPHCDEKADSKTVFTKEVVIEGQEKRWRRKQCLNCRKRYTTYETIVVSPPKPRSRKERPIVTRSIDNGWLERIHAKLAAL